MIIAQFMTTPKNDILHTKKRKEHRRREKETTIQKKNISNKHKTFVLVRLSSNPSKVSMKNIAMAHDNINFVVELHFLFVAQY